MKVGALKVQTAASKERNERQKGENSRQVNIARMKISFL